MVLRPSAGPRVQRQGLLGDARCLGVQRDPRAGTMAPVAFPGASESSQPRALTLRRGHGQSSNFKDGNCHLDTAGRSVVSLFLAFRVVGTLGARVASVKAPGSRIPTVNQARTNVSKVARGWSLPACCSHVPSRAFDLGSGCREVQAVTLSSLELPSSRAGL